MGCAAIPPPVRHTFFGLISLLWLLPAPAAACSCVELSAQDAFDQHAAVFEGRVVEVHRPDDPGGALRVVLDVVQHWKGVTTERVELSTPAASSLCGVSFEPETSWLVYAEAADGALSTDICHRTRPMADASEDLATLGAGVVPVEITEEDEVEPPADDDPPARGGCASCSSAPGRPAFGGLFALALGLLLIRRS